MIGIDSDKLNSICDELDTYVDSIKRNINSVESASGTIISIFNQNGLTDAVNGLNKVNTNYQKIASVLSSYSTTLRKVKEGYQKQSDAVASSFNTSTIHIN